MAFVHINKVSLIGISACVPRKIIENKQYPGLSSESFNKIIKSIGVEKRRIADSSTCTSDLCFHAAEKLISDLYWPKSSIDSLILVTQTPDYILPATSSILQHRLCLKEDIFTLDISLGCSGWIHGLQVISSLLSHGSLRRGLLLVGDTTLKFCSPEDHSSYMLFGDAGAATAIEYNKTSEGFKFHTASDGSGYKAIIIPDGGYRNPISISSLDMVENISGIRRNRLQVVLDGMDVFSFSLAKAPESILQLSEKYNIELQQIDHFVFHQANMFINERIRKKLAIPKEKVPYSLRDYGNTGPSTIPLTMVSQLGKDLQTNNRSIIACGFGVGLSWGSVHFNTNKIVCSNIVEI